jgi:heme ABC exporter ATP-binding subunit CcmA
LARFWIEHSDAANSDCGDVGTSEMIQFKGLTKHYGKTRAVRELDLNLMSGEVFALLGSNGSGKSTALKLTAGLLKPTHGEVLINSIPAWQAPPAAKTNLAYLPQRLVLPESLTVREILGFFASVRNIAESAIDHALEEMSLSNHADKKVGELSGGMVQRLGLAIVFLGEPQVLLLDEPTLNLDPEGMRLLNRLVRGLRDRGATVLLASHVLSNIEDIADRVGIMVEGRLAMIEVVDQFREALTVGSVLTVGMDNRQEGFLQVVEKAGATGAHYTNSHMEIEVVPGKRLRVLNALEDAGADVGPIATRTPTLEQLISDQLKGAE